MLEQARASAYRAVNVAMAHAYWHVRRLIVEHEQGGRRRAGYREALSESLSDKLTSEFGRGFTATNLRYMRQYYLAFPIHHALRDKSEAGGKLNAMRSESGIHHATGERGNVVIFGKSAEKSKTVTAWAVFALFLAKCASNVRRMKSKRV